MAYAPAEDVFTDADAKIELAQALFARDPGIVGPAFALVAALITRDSDVVLDSILLNPTRTGLIETLRLMGGDLTIHDRRQSGGEPLGDIRARSSGLRGVLVPAARAPSMPSGCVCVGSADSRLPSRPRIVRRTTRSTKPKRG